MIEYVVTWNDWDDRIDDDKRDEYDCYWMRICVIECTEMIDNGMNCDE